jgi:hypothetical protein
MSHFGNQDTITFTASGDLSGKQFHIMRANGEGTCAQASLSTDLAIIGVLQNKPQNAERATIAVEGVSKVVAGGALTANALITSNSSGRAAAVSSGSSDLVIGRVLEAAGADGEIVPALLSFPVQFGKGAV